VTVGADDDPIVVSLRDTIDTEPWQLYEHLQQHGVVWDDQISALLIGSYDLVRSTLRQDEKVFRRPKGDRARNDPYLAALQRSPRDITLIYGEDHQRFHRWWYQALSHTNCERWRPTRIRPVVDAVISRFVGRGRADLSSEFAVQVPIRVIASILGLPWEDDEWIESGRAYMQSRMDYQEACYRAEVLQSPPPDIVEIGQRAAGTANEFGERLVPFVARALAGTHLDDDLISMYAKDGPDIFPDWGMDDMVAGIFTAFAAGSDTTSHGVANGVYLLVTRPELQEELRAGGDAAFAGFVEEALRILGVAHIGTLDVTVDTEIGGIPVKKGSVVVPVLGAANVDPRHYECPFDVRLDRRNPRDHTTFWMGPRACGGMWLARAELVEMYAGLLSRLRDLRLDPAAEVPTLHGWVVRSYRPLHVLFAT
jgi:cytochrome P450